MNMICNSTISFCHPHKVLGFVGVLFCIFMLLYGEVFAEAHDTKVHRVGLVDEGYESLLFRLHLIESAQDTIEIQTFIWENDECGKAFMQACVDAAQRGVHVRFLMDHYYSGSDLDTMVALSQVSPHLEIRRYRPHRNRLNTKLHTNLGHLATSFRARNQRMHNKVLIVDGRIALPGGRNISNHYFDYFSDRNYLDRDLLVTGPLVSELKESFEAYWAYKHSKPLRDLKDVKAALRQDHLPVWEATPIAARNAFMQALYRDASQSAAIEQKIHERLRSVDSAWVSVDPPGKNRGVGLLGMQSGSRSAQDILTVMKTADESIVIQSPYMVMTAGTKKFFRRQQQNKPHVTVELSTNSYASTGNMPAYAGAFRSRPHALRYGIQVYELKPVPEDLNTFMGTGARQEIEFDKYSVHAKSFVVDSKTAYVGSFNLDPRSIHLNTELGIVVEDEAFAAELETSIRLALLPGNSWRVEYRDLPFAGVNRSVEWTSHHLPLDVWPIASTANYDEQLLVGVLPVQDRTSFKRWQFRLHRTIGFFTRPLI